MQCLLPGAEQSTPVPLVLLGGLASRYHVKLKKLSVVLLSFLEHCR